MFKAPRLIRKGTVLAYLRASQIAENELTRQKLRLEKWLQSDEEPELVSHEWRIRGEPHIAACCGFHFEFDLSGEMICDLHARDRQDLGIVFFNVFPVEDETVVLLSWERRHDPTYGVLAQQMNDLGEAALRITVSNIIACYCENFACTPSWWDAMDSNAKARFVESYTSTMTHLDSDLRQKLTSSWGFDLFLPKP